MTEVVEEEEDTGDNASAVAFRVLKMNCTDPTNAYHNRPAVDLYIYGVGFLKKRNAGSSGYTVVLLTFDRFSRWIPSIGGVCGFQISCRSLWCAGEFVSRPERETNTTTTQVRGSLVVNSVRVNTTGTV